MLKHVQGCFLNYPLGYGFFLLSLFTHNKSCDLSTSPSKLSSWEKMINNHVTSFFLYSSFNESVILCATFVISITLDNYFLMSIHLMHTIYINIFICAMLCDLWFVVPIGLQWSLPSHSLNDLTNMQPPSFKSIWNFFQVVSIMYACYLSY